MINELRNEAEILPSLPRVQRSRDPDDDYLLAMAEGGGADFLVTGNQNDLLSLVRHSGTRIISARDFAEVVR